MKKFEDEKIPGVERAYYVSEMEALIGKRILQSESYQELTTKEKRNLRETLTADKYPWLIRVD